MPSLSRFRSSAHPVSKSISVSSPNRARPGPIVPVERGPRHAGKDGSEGGRDASLSCATYARHAPVEGRAKKPRSGGLVPHSTPAE
jgi:hypothetical protein